MKYLLPVFFLLFTITTTYAQEDKPDLSTYYPVYVGSVINEDDVSNYIQVLKQHKNPREDVFKIVILDNNMNAETDFFYKSRKSNYKFMEFSFNGEVVLLKFMSTEKKTKYVGVNGVGEVQFEKIFDTDIADHAVLGLVQPRTNSIEAVPSYGFLEYPITTTGKIINLIKSDGEIFEFDTHEKKKLRIPGTYYYIGNNGENFFTLAKYGGTSHIIGTNLESGKMVFKVKDETEDNVPTTIYKYYDEAKKEIVIHSSLNSTEGVQILKLADNGEIILKKDFIFSEEIKDIVINKKGKWEGFGYVTIQKILPHDNGYNLLLRDSKGISTYASSTNKFNDILKINVDKDFNYIDSERLNISKIAYDDASKRALNSKTGGVTGKLTFQYDQYYQKDNVYYSFYAETYGPFNNISELGIIKIENGELSKNSIQLKEVEVAKFATKKQAKGSLIEVFAAKRGYFLVKSYKADGDDWIPVFNFEKINL